MSVMRNVWILIILHVTFPITLSLPGVDEIRKCFYVEQICPNKFVKFFLYRRETQKQPNELNLFNKSSLNPAYFNRKMPVIILIHGYTGHHDFSPNTEIRPAYFQKGDYNIISVDYQPLAPEPCYPTAVKNLQTVANCTAQLIDLLVESKMFQMKHIHIIGFSLGGQTAGMIAMYIKQGPLERITALDPAKPLFIRAPKEQKIDVGDANFVDVIHTDVLQRGILAPAGHIDFYVNGGVEQRGCNAQKIMDAGSCNHARAPEYYAESINSKIGFWGFRCPHWYLYALGLCQEEEAEEIALMGMHCNKSSRGLYFLATNAESPYARGHNFSVNVPFVNTESGEMVDDLLEVDDNLLHSIHQKVVVI